MKTTSLVGFWDEEKTGVPGEKRKNSKNLSKALNEITSRYLVLNFC